MGQTSQDRGPRFKNFIVLWRPADAESTVEYIRCIDAWSSTGTLQEAREDAAKKHADYKVLYGNGAVEVVEQKRWTHL
jgi:hypothetical protein